MTLKPTRGVPVAAVVDAMRARWTTHGNVPNEALLETWAQIASTFNVKLIAAPSTDWYVLSPATGTGKTETAIAYASLLPQYSPGDGMLLVTRFKASADHLAKEINTAAGAEVAKARHTDAPVEASELREYPIAIVTHAAFERALDRVKGGRVWDLLSAYGDTTRRLIVVDEAIDLLEVTKLTEDDLSRLVGLIPGYIRAEYKAEHRYLEDLLRALRDWLDAARGSEHRILQDNDRALFNRLFEEVPDFSGLQAALRKHRHFGSTLRGTSSAANEQAHDEVASTFTKVRELIQSFVLTSRAGRAATFSTARLIIPEDAQGCVILDATAHTNKFYDVVAREDGSRTIHLPRPPAGARTYANVRLNVARVSGAGKGTMLARHGDGGGTVGKTEAERLLAWLETHRAEIEVELAGPMTGVFIACHKDNVCHFEAARKTFPVPMKVANYGAIDGSNGFRDCNVGILFGLPYRERMDASLAFFAAQGVQADAWLNDEGRRAFRGYTDIREALYLGWVATDATQVLNRPAIRCVVDTEGNCPRCWLGLMVPDDPSGDHILNVVRSQMPGLPESRPWDFGFQGRRAKAPRAPRVLVNYEDKLASFAENNMEPGSKLSAKQVRLLMGLNPPRWAVLAEKAKDAASELHSRLRALGATYAMERLGSRTAAYLVKT